MSKIITIEKKGYGTVQRDFMKMNISVYAKCVYTLLRTYTGDKVSCFPSLNTICEDLSVSKNTIIKAIKELESINLIAVKRSKKMDKNVNLVNVYIPLALTETIDLSNDLDGSCGEPHGSCGEPPVVHVVNPNNNNTNNNINNESKDFKKSKKTFTPPTEKAVIDYFDERGYTEEAAKLAYEFYAVADWIDSRGCAVKNWKQKMLSVWFKPENKKADVIQKKIIF